MDPGYGYVFPALRGIQSGREYFVSQCPMVLIPRLFAFDDADVPVEIRAQRSLNRQRVPEIAEYIVNNRSSYVFSALTVSIDAEVKFTTIGSDPPSDKIGLLHVPMSARFVINDGQHRRAAIELALQQDPTIGEEDITVVFFLDQGLERCQQMFADLNRYAIRPSASIGVLYDHRDPISSVTRAVAAELPLYRDLVEREKTALSTKSRKLLTLSALHQGTRALTRGLDLKAGTVVGCAEAFWRAVADGFTEWRLVHERSLSAGEVRRDFIHPYSIVIHAVGNVGNALLRDNHDHLDWSDLTDALNAIDWQKSNPEWSRRAIVGGRISKGHANVLLVGNVIKRKLELELGPDEIHAEQSLANELEII